MSIVVTLGAVVAAFLVARARPTIALTALLVETFLVPAALLLPFGGSDLVTIHRFVVFAGLLASTRGRHRSSASFSPTILHFAAVAYLFVVLILGVLLAGEEITLLFSLNRWLSVVDAIAFLFLMIGLIRSIEPVVRADGRRLSSLDRAGARVAVVVAVMCVIAIAERFTGASYAQQFAALVDSVRPGLETRGGALRIRGAADFSLAFAWIVVMMVPLLVVIASRRGTWRWSAPLVLAVPAVAWTFSRSAYGGLVVAVVLMMIGGAVSQRMAGRLSLGFVAGVPILLASDLLVRAFETQDAAGAFDVRVDRLPMVLRLAAGDPIAGIGFTGLEARAGIGTTDSTFLLTYVETGVIGLVATVLLFGAMLAALAPGLRDRDRGARAYSVAGAVSLVTALAAGFSFDTFSNSQSTRPFLAVVAIGVVAADRRRNRCEDELLRLPPKERFLAVVGAAAVGLVVLVSAPTTDAAEYRFTTFAPGSEALASSPAEFAGRVLVRSACDHAREVARDIDPALDIDCARRFGLGADVGELRIAGDDVAIATAAILDGVTEVQSSVRFFEVRIVDDARPAGLATAPVWLPLFVLGGLFLVPRRSPFGSDGDAVDEDERLPVEI